MPKASQMLIRMRAPLKAALNQPHGGKRVQRARDHPPLGTIARGRRAARRPRSRPGDPADGRRISPRRRAWDDRPRAQARRMGTRPCRSSGRDRRGNRRAARHRAAGRRHERSKSRGKGHDRNDRARRRNHSQDWRRKMSGHIRERVPAAAGNCAMSCRAVLTANAAPEPRRSTAPRGGRSPVARAYDLGRSRRARRRE